MNQQVIRDEELGGIMMIPLFVDWKIKRCNVKGCTFKPTTILTQPHPTISAMGLCEVHYQNNLDNENNLVLKCTVEFNDYDAFADKEVEDV